METRSWLVPSLLYSGGRTVRSVTKGSARGDGKEAHLSLLRSLRKDDDDVNENGKKTSRNLQQPDFLQDNTWFVGGKTHNTTIQSLQQCCKTSFTFLLPVLPYAMSSMGLFWEQCRFFYFHIELIRIKECYGKCRVHEHGPIYSLSIYARFSGQFFFTFPRKRL